MPTTALEGVHEAGAPLGKPLLASSPPRLLRIASPKAKAQWQRLASATTTHAKGFGGQMWGTTRSRNDPLLLATSSASILLHTSSLRFGTLPEDPPDSRRPVESSPGDEPCNANSGVAPRQGRERARLTCSPRAEATTPPPRPVGRHRRAPAPRPRGPSGSLGSGAPTPRSPSPGSSGRQRAPTPLAGLSVLRDGCARARLRAPAAPAGQRTTRGARNPGSGGSAPKTPARRPGVPGSRSFLFPRPVLKGMGVLII